jgi:hypothetical protein
MSLIQEKGNRAIEILKEKNTDIWLTVVRETSGVRDPVSDFLIGAEYLGDLQREIILLKASQPAHPSDHRSLRQ